MGTTGPGRVRVIDCGRVVRHATHSALGVEWVGPNICYWGGGCASVVGGAQVGGGAGGAGGSGQGAGVGERHQLGGVGRPRRDYRRPTAYSKM